MIPRTPSFSIVIVLTNAAMRSPRGGPKRKNREETMSDDKPDLKVARRDCRLKRLLPQDLRTELRPLQRAAEGNISQGPAGGQDHLRGRAARAHLLRRTIRERYGGHVRRPDLRWQQGQDRLEDAWLP